MCSRKAKWHIYCFVPCLCISSGVIVFFFTVRFCVFVLTFVAVSQLFLRHRIYIMAFKQRVRKSLMSAKLIWVTQTHTLMQCTLLLCSFGSSKLTNFCKENYSWQKGRNYNDDNQAVFGSCCYLTMLGWCYKQPGFDGAWRDSCRLFPHITSHEFMLLSLAGCCGEIFILSLMSM